MKLQVPADLAKITDQEAFNRFASQIFGSVSEILKGNLSFTDNFRCAFVSVNTPGAANTEFPVVHNLNNSNPSWLVIQKNGACDLYRGPSSNLPNTLYLKSTSGAVSVLILVF